MKISKWRESKEKGRRKERGGGRWWGKEEKEK